jgi:multidrug resistance efflux pump
VRAKDLFEHGAISQSMLEQAEDAEKDAKADLTAAEEQLKFWASTRIIPAASSMSMRPSPASSSRRT